MNCKRCDKPIEDHQAGSETDACVAVVVMEWRQLEEDGPLVHPNTNLIYGYDKEDDLAEYVSHFSTSIAEAWKVWEKIRDTKRIYGALVLEDDGENVEVGWKESYHDEGWAWESLDWPVEAKTAPHAICKAALQRMTK